MRRRSTTTPWPMGMRRASATSSSRRSMRCRTSNAGLLGLTELLLQRHRYVGRDEVGDIIAQGCDFSDARAADEEVLELGKQVDRLDFGRHLAVHQRHVELVVEVSVTAHAAD